MPTPEEPARKNADTPLDKSGQILQGRSPITFSAGCDTSPCEGRPTYSLHLTITSIFALWLIGCRGIEPNSPRVGNDTPPAKGGGTAAQPFKIQVGSGEIKLQGGETPLQVKLDSTPINVEGAVELKTNLADVFKGDAIPLKISGLDKPISIRLEGWPTKESPAEVHVSGPAGTQGDSEINKVVEELKLQLRQTEERLTNEMRSLKIGALPPENPNGRAVENKLESIDQHLATLATLFQSAITLWKKGDGPPTSGSPLSTEKLEEIKDRLDEVKAQLGPDGFLNRQIQDLTTRIEELEEGGKVEHKSEIKPMKIQWLSVASIIATILSAGVLGGLISAYAIPNRRQSKPGSKLDWVRILEAVAAAAFVPGVLFAIHSDLLDKAEKYSYLVALFSLCVIAATIGAPFIQFVHNKAAIWMLRSQRDESSSSRPPTAVLNRVAEQLDSLPGAPATRIPLRKLKAWVEFLINYVPEDKALGAVAALEEFVAEAVKEKTEESRLQEIGKRLVEFESNIAVENKIMPSLVGDVIKTAGQTGSSNT
jgi:hypothetical protein